VAQFNENSTYLMGWFRDYLWLNSSQLINGYNPYGMNNLSVWAWMFLFGHLVWATGFMFLISWRGYWQELIETIVWAHERTPSSEPGSLEGQARCPVHRSGSFGWFGSLHSGIILMPPS
jgi:hypothetical protein